MEHQLLIIVNPAAGEGKAVIEVAATVLPILEKARIPYQLKVTEEAGHAGTLAREFIGSGDGKVILIVGGDGTVHEVVNGLALEGSGVEDSDVALVLWPGGTANALYASLFPPESSPPNHPPRVADLVPGIHSEEDEQTDYKLRSLLCYIGSRQAVPQSTLVRKQLVIAHTEIFDRSSKATSQTLSVVVTSASLHASILQTADELRSSIPSIDRFKKAAQINITKWSDSVVTLYGEPLSEVQRYDPTSQSFKPHAPLYPTKEGTSDQVELHGPFSYFLSTVNVDRLEPTFKIAPLYTTLPPDSSKPATMDILLLRPKRDPNLQKLDSYNQEVKAKFGSEVAFQVLSQAYQQGAHVDLTYEAREGEEERAIVEYFRATGWDWTPDATCDESSRLICADGTILTIPAGGKATCRVIPLLQPDTPNFYVWNST